MILRNRYVVHVWQERDRASIWVEDIDTGSSVAEWYDEQVSDMFEDGFFVPHNLEHSVICYLEDMGVIQ